MVPGPAVPRRLATEYPTGSCEHRNEEEPQPMNEKREIDPAHQKIRTVLRVVGPAVAALGLVLTAVGIISFFRSFGTFEPPRYFVCAIVGIPLLGVGLSITQVGYVGSIGRYFMN